MGLIWWGWGHGRRFALGTAASAAVRAAIASFGDHPFMIDKAGAPMIVAHDAFLPPEAAAEDRFVELAVSAAAEALEWLAPVRLGRIRLHVLLGLPPQRPGLPSRLEATLWRHLEPVIQAWAKPAPPVFFSTGHSSGLMALQEAQGRLTGGSADLCLVGGVESYLSPETLEWLDECDRLHSETQTWGFIPGEAAGFVLVGTREWTRHHEVSLLGGGLGVATAHEKNLINTDSVCLGEGLSGAFRQALGMLPAAETRIDHMICDLNGEPYRADEFGYTMVRTADRFVDASHFLTPADCWGDVGAASGPLFVILALAAGLRGYANGPYTLVWTSSEGGQRCAAVVQIEHPGRA